MNESEQIPQEYLESEPIFINKTAEFISVVIAIAATTVGQETLGPLAGPSMIALHGILFGGLKTAYQETNFTTEDFFTKEGIQFMVKESLKAAVLPFIASASINNREAIGNTLTALDQTIGITNGLQQLLQSIGEGIVQYAPKVAAGTALAVGGGIAIKKAGKELFKALSAIKQTVVDGVDMSLAYARSFEPQSPIEKTQKPIKEFKVEFQWPIKLRGFLKKRRTPEGE